MRFVLSTAMLLSVLFTSATNATDFDVCHEAEETSSTITRDHADLGGGVVTYVTGNFGWGIGASTLNIEACANGDTVHATYRLDQIDTVTGKQVRAFDVSEAFDAVWNEAVTSDANVTFEMLETRFSGVGAEVTRSVNEWESCACHLAYPTLRGTKEEFDRIR